MSTLLHIDSSINGEQSHSRKVTATFAQQWSLAHPQGRYIYRDLAAEPLPHLDSAAYRAANTPAAEHTPEEATAWRVSESTVEELTAADVVLLGAPMYNFSVPSNLKAWMDRIAIQRFMADDSGRSPLSDKRFIVATSRGGSYAPGTPREGFDHQEPYLRSFFSMLGVGEHLTFLHTEMVLSNVVPELAKFKDVYESTSRAAHEAARELASA